MSEQEVTRFTLDDFDDLTEAERKFLAADTYALGKLRDRFLDACGWSEAAQVAVDVWRTEFAVT